MVGIENEQKKMGAIKLSINPIALNFVAIIGYMFLFYWLFTINRILLILASIDCGTSCLPNWVHFDYVIDKYYLVITICSLLFFVLLCFFTSKTGNKNDNKKITFLKLLLLILKTFGVVLFITNVICTFLYF